MALRPDEFYEHALAAADAEGRLPLARMTGWEISPFEQEGLRVAPLRPPVPAEPAREGEDPTDCRSCRNRDDGIWLDDRWRLTRIADVGMPLVLMLHTRDHYDLSALTDELAAQLGVLTAHIGRHIEALPNIARAHVYRIGDGGAHLHIWFFARPAGQTQLRGSWLVVWDDLVPAYPADVAETDAAIVAAALADSFAPPKPTPSAAAIPNELRRRPQRASRLRRRTRCCAGATPCRPCARPDCECRSAHPRSASSRPRAALRHHAQRRVASGDVIGAHPRLVVVRHDDDLRLRARNQRSQRSWHCWLAVERRVRVVVVRSRSACTRCRNARVRPIASAFPTRGSS